MKAEPGSVRVLMTTDAVGGVWQYCVDLLKSLRCHNVEFLLATLGPLPSAEQKIQLAGLSNVTLVESEYPLEWMPGALDQIDASSRWLLGLQQKFKADFIHLNGYCHAALPWGSPVLVVAHSCVFSWWKAVYGGAPPRDNTDWSQYRLNVAKGLAAASCVVAPSCDMAVSLQREYKVSAEKIDVVYNSSRVPVSRASRRQAKCLAAGRIWDAAKNLTVLDQIAPKVTWPIQVAGDNSGPLRSAERLKHIKLLGVITHKALINELRAASIFLHPSLYEPFGLSVLEAARSGCCLVLADIPSLRELWEGHAQFVDARDPEHWIFELDGLARDRSRRERLALSAQTHSLRYSTDRCVSAYLSMYNGLVGRQRETVAGGAAA